MSGADRRIRCPLCGRPTTWRENPFRPFCSERCRLADLDGWLRGRYVVPGEPDEAAPLPPDDLSDEPPLSESGKKT
ncbi:MAG TPA: DNA gyrase inhibitor YacG [Alphaproteobacteria bacterium]|nr:DNA gyrase inhibitor YacG [Alphaproteobacteria bacterium]